MSILKNKIKNLSFMKWIKLMVFRFVWRKENKSNYTKALNCFSRKKVSVGIGTYGDLFIKHFGNEDERISIGSYCSIAPEVKFLLGGEHNYSSVMTYPIANKLINNENESITKGPIIIGDDVWIGYGAMILSGVKIGQGAVIAAGSIVFKDVPPYAVYSTNRIIKYRFAESIIKELCEIDFSKVDYKNLTGLYKKYNQFNNVDIEMVKSLRKDIQMIR